MKVQRVVVNAKYKGLLISALFVPHTVEMTYSGSLKSARDGFSDDENRGRNTLR